LKSKDKKVLVVIPTYNESENIKLLIPQIRSLDISPDVLIVDDNSPDGTSAIVEKMIENDPHIILIKRPLKLGLGTAHIAGFKYALENNYYKVVSMDADFSHNPSSIPNLVSAADNFDVILGSRYVPGGGVKNWSIFRWCLSRGSNLLAKLLLRLKNKDCTGGFRCYNRYVLEKIDFTRIKSDGYSFLVELLFNIQSLKYKIGEVPIIFEDRAVGISKISRKEIYKAIMTLLRLTLH
jgi:dolichol-phosphate mannosyltransferase